MKILSKIIIKKKVYDCIINVQLRKISSIELEYHTYPKQSRLEGREVSAKALCIINTH